MLYSETFTLPTCLVAIKCKFSNSSRSISAIGGDCNMWRRNILIWTTEFFFFRLKHLRTVSLRGYWWPWSWCQDKRDTDSVQDLLDCQFLLNTLQALGRQQMNKTQLEMPESSPPVHLLSLTTAKGQRQEQE